MVFKEVDRTSEILSGKSMCSGGEREGSDSDPEGSSRDWGHYRRSP